MVKDFDKLATALFGLYWGTPLVEADVLSRDRAEAIRNGAEPTLEEQRALCCLAYERRAAISFAVGPVQEGVIKAMGHENPA